MDIKKIKLQSSEILLRKLIQRTKDVICLWDVQFSHILFVNHAFEQIWGRSALVLYEQPQDWWQYIFEEDRRNLPSIEELRNLYHTNPSRCDEEEFRICRPDGSLRWIKLTRIPIQNEYGECIAVGTISRDMTGVKQWEQTIHGAIENKEELSNHQRNFWLTHGNLLNLHLNELMSAVQLLSAHTLPSPHRNALHSIHDHATQLTTLLGDALDFYRIGEEEFGNKTVNFNLRHAVEGLQDCFSQLFTFKSIRFAINVAPELDGYFLGDIERIKQALRNLILLISQPSDVQVICLQIRSLSHTQNSVLCQIALNSVRDYLGQNHRNEYCKNNQKEITDIEHNPYFMLASELIEKLNGQLIVQQNDRKGMQFLFKLELVYQESQTKINYPNGEIKLEKLLLTDKRKHIKPIAHGLIVEDNVINQHVVSLILSEIGCTADIVSDGHQALAMWDRDYDFVFLDIGLPGMDGFEVAQKLKANKKKHNVPIIGMSAHMAISDKDKLMLGPLDDFINKPFGLASVDALVKKWVTHQKERKVIGQDI